jgi:hypothetical protein
LRDIPQQQRNIQGCGDYMQNRGEVGGVHCMRNVNELKSCPPLAEPACLCSLVLVSVVWACVLCAV